MKVKVREITKGCKFEYINKGEWIDLKSAIDINIPSCEAESLKRRMFKGVEYRSRLIDMPVYKIPLGIAMQLPEGYEAIIAPRSSTPFEFNVIQANSIGIIDNSYCGNDDEWQFTCIPLKDASIKKGDRICQFRIQLSQKATIWQKIKWLFSNKIKFIWVDKLENNNRGGFGTTGVK